MIMSIKRGSTRPEFSIELLEKPLESDDVVLLLMNDECSADKGHSKEDDDENGHAQRVHGT